MIRGVRFFVMALFALVVVASFLLSGCTRYANEEQLTTLDESDAAAVAAENKVAEKERERDELQRKLAEKQEELRKVQAEKEKVKKGL